MIGVENERVEWEGAENKSGSEDWVENRERRKVSGWRTRTIRGMGYVGGEQVRRMKVGGGRSEVRGGE